AHPGTAMPASCVPVLVKRATAKLLVVPLVECPAIVIEPFDCRATAFAAPAVCGCTAAAPSPLKVVSGAPFAFSLTASSPFALPPAMTILPLGWTATAFPSAAPDSTFGSVLPPVPKDESG